jgi:tetratricopeptide (TPR) repeat protein
MLEAGASTQPPEEMARTLGATMLLHGSVQEAGDLLRVNATLVSLDGTVLWSRGEEARRDQLFAMQNRLAESLLSELRVKVTTAEQQDLARAPTQDAAALDAYLRGVALLDRPGDFDFDAAVSYFNQATALDKGFSLAFAALGEAYRRRSVRTNDAVLMDQAEAAVNEAFRLDAGRPEVLLSLARVHRSTGRPAAAVDEVRKVLAVQPNNDNAYRLLGDLLAKSGKPQEAHEALRMAADLRPNYWQNQEALGLFFYGNGQLPDAIRAFTRLTQLKADDPNPFQQLGAMYLAKGDLVLARRNFEESNKRRENAGSYANLGTIAYYEQRYDDAIRQYEAALRLEPTVAAHQGNLGDALQKRGRRTEARAAYLKAIEMGEQALGVNQNDVTTVSRLGVYYAKVGKVPEAKRYANRAARTKPDDPDVLYLRAVALAFIGERDAAVTQLAEAIDRGYSVQLARQDDELASLRELPAFQRLLEPKAR